MSIQQQNPLQSTTNIQIPIPQYRLFTITRDEKEKEEIQLSDTTADLCRLKSPEDLLSPPRGKQQGFQLNKNTFQKMRIRMLKIKRNKRLMLLSKATTSVNSNLFRNPPKEAFYCLNEPIRKETCSEIDLRFEDSDESEIPLNRKRVQKILSIFDERYLRTRKLLELRKQRGCFRMVEMLEKKNSALKGHEQTVTTSLNKTIKKLKERIKEISELEF